MDTEAVRVAPPAPRQACSEGLDSENAKADTILNRVFPPSVAKALKEGRKVCLLQPPAPRSELFTPFQPSIDFP